MEVLILKAESGKVFRNGHIYSTVVRVRKEWVDEWRLVDEAAMFNDIEAERCKMFIHVLNKKLR